jgi:2,3-bisphosphoglycerate-independent phosphoglycerate mutase
MRDSSSRRVLLVPDGMADEPLDELGGLTPLEAAETPNMDAVARAGVMGMVHTVPAGLPPGSDVANLAVLGYDPRAVYTGRAPLEAANIGVELGPGDVAYRCNLVDIRDGVMHDFTAGHVASASGAAVMARLQARLGGGAFEFHPGVSYRNLMVWRGGSADAVCTPPHDILDRPVLDHLPGGPAGPELRDLMDRARVEMSGLSPATDIWLWGQGTAPRIPLFFDLRGLNGAVVGAVDLVKGIGRYAGFEVLDIPGATGDLATDYGAKARAALDVMSRVDLVFVHVEAPDEAGHMGDVAEKVKAIEAVDREVLGPLLASPLEPSLLVVPDHPTPVRLRTHVGDAVPFAFAAAVPRERGALAGPGLGERSAAATGVVAPSGADLMDRFLAATS